MFMVNVVSDVTAVHMKILQQQRQKMQKQFILPGDVSNPDRRPM